MTASVADAQTTLRPVETVLATLALVALSCVTAIGFCRVFQGWAFLPTMLLAVLAAHTTAFVLRLLRMPVWVAMPVVLLVIAMIVAWKLYPSTMAGPFPTAQSWDLLRTDLALAREQFPSAVPPVAAVGGFYAGACLAAALAAALSDAFAFRAFGRAEAVTPCAVLFIFASALGVDRNRVAVTALWLATALGVVALLRATHAQSEHTWVGSRRRITFSVAPVAAVLAVLAAAGAAFAGPRLPGANDRGLIDTHHRTDITQVLSPLVDIRSQLINLPNLEMFTVKASEPGYWRVTGLSEFDGTTWGLPADDELRASSPESIPTMSGSHIVAQRVRITSLGGALLPAAFSVVSVSDSRVFWVNDTGTLVVPDEGLQTGAEYDVQSELLDPTPDQLRNSTSTAPNPIYLELPNGLPADAIAAAREQTAAGTTPYDKVLLLQNWFRNTFTYDLTVQRGHSNNAISNFLRVKRGYCEQFAGTFAAMARSLGIPARVAVGFTQGDLGTDGSYHVFGRHAHAWDEVYFDGIGWVPFDPTPGRGQPGEADTTGVTPEQAGPTAGGQGGNVTTAVPVTAPPVRDGAQPTPNSVARDTKDDNAAAAAESTFASSSATRGWPLVLLVLMAALVLWAVVMPRIVAAIVRRREPTSPAASVQRNWTRTGRALAVIGVEPAPSATPCELAERAHQTTGVDQHALRELAQRATALFYGGLVDEHAKQRCESLTNIVLLSVNERLTSKQRLLARLNPRLAMDTSIVGSTHPPVLTGQG